MKTSKEDRLVDINGTKYLIKTYFFGDLNAKNTLILSPGFSVPGQYFAKFSNLLLKELSDFLIVVPEIIGKRIKSEDGLIYSNDSHKTSSELYSAFLNQLGDVSVEASLSDFYTAGHSSGPINSESKKLILINPLIVPVNYGRNGFLRRGLINNFPRDMLFCMGTSYGLNYANEFINNWENNILTLTDLTKLGMKDIYPERKNTHVLHISGVNNKIQDQFSDYMYAIVALSPRFKSYQQKFVKPGSHHSILYNPEPFVKPIKDFILL